MRHVIFIEEAHNIIASSTNQSSTDSIDPKISATAYIVKMLAEVRALREAIVIADQLPTALAIEVTKNTGLKLVHRLTAKDDREQIGTAISASPLQLEQMATFTTGKALIYHEKTQKPFEVQIAEWIPPDVSYDLSNDTHLYYNIIHQQTVVRSITAAFRNWKEKYMFAVDDQINELRNRWLKVDYDDITEMGLCKSKKKSLLLDCEMLIKKCKRLEKLWFNGKIQKHPLKEEFDEVYDYIENMRLRVQNINFID